MSIQSLESFTILEELYSTEFFTAHRAIHQPTSTTVRLTRMSAEVSASVEFRSAFRTDEANLGALEHANVLKLHFWGEDSGSMFYATDFPDGESLQLKLEGGCTFSWDEFIDLGWQIASALQHCHNLGITHGQLSTNSVIVSDSLRVKLAGFGVYRWISATTETGALAFSDLATQDLIDLGRLLRTLHESVRVESVEATSEQQRSDMRSLLETLKSPPLDFTARDVQGRLGDMLLAVSGDSIDMIDDRKGQGLSRRSLVDELFDEADSTTSKSAAESASQSPAFSWWWVLLLILIAAVIAVLSSGS